MKKLFVRLVAAAFIFTALVQALNAQDINPTPIFSTAYRSNSVIVRKTTWRREYTKPDSPAMLQDEVVSNIRWDKDSDTELYLDGDKVVIYSPLTRTSVNIQCADNYGAQQVFYYVSLRITYYHAEDRSWYNKTARVKDLNNNYVMVPADDSRDREAWYKFIQYLFNVDSQNYNTTYDKFMVCDRQTFIDSDLFIEYVNKFKVTGNIKHTYADITDTNTMEQRVRQVYDQATLKRWLD